MTAEPRRLDGEGRRALADALGESPFTILAVHNLLRGRCEAWAVGEPPRHAAAVVRMSDLPKEPEGYGPAEPLWRILRQLDGWDCVNLAEDQAAELAEILRRDAGVPAELYADLYHVLDGPAPATFDHPDVRLMGPPDVPLLERMGEMNLGHDGYDTPMEAVTDGVFAAAVADGRIVAVAKATAIGRRFANIGAETHAAHRGRGYATAAASLVAGELRRRGLVPVWSAGQANAASLRVAAKLGFRPFGRKTYVVRRRSMQKDE